MNDIETAVLLCNH